MVRWFLLFSSIMMVACPSFVRAEEEPYDNYNPVFGYTHLAPSPFTLQAGKVVFGTDVTVGVTDFLSVGTGLLRDAFQFYNANAKVSLASTSDFACALTFTAEAFNYDTISSNNPNYTVVTYQPGAVAAYAIIPNLAVFAYGDLSLSHPDPITSGIDTAGYVSGSLIGSDVSWAYSPGKKRIGNAVSAGVTYDLTYQIFGFGVSHHWPGYQVGLHYYPNATQYKVQPILAGGYVYHF